MKPQVRPVVILFSDQLLKKISRVLRSDLHRVTRLPGKQEKATAYSFVYFVRLVEQSIDEEVHRELNQA
jgi:hypothetical protein